MLSSENRRRGATDTIACYNQPVIPKDRRSWHVTDTIVCISLAGGLPRAYGVLSPVTTTV